MDNCQDLKNRITSLETEFRKFLKPSDIIFKIQGLDGYQRFSDPINDVYPDRGDRFSQEYFGFLISIMKGELFDLLEPMELSGILYQNGCIEISDKEAIDQVQNMKGRFAACQELFFRARKRKEKWAILFLEAIKESEQEFIKQKMDPSATPGLDDDANDIEENESNGCNSPGPISRSVSGILPVSPIVELSSTSEDPISQSTVNTQRVTYMPTVAIDNATRVAPDNALRPPIPSTQRNVNSSEVSNGKKRKLTQEDVFEMQIAVLKVQQEMFKEQTLLAKEQQEKEKKMIEKIELQKQLLSALKEDATTPPLTNSQVSYLNVMSACFESS